MSGPITADILDEIFAKKDIGLESDLNTLEKAIESSLTNHESLVNYFSSQRNRLADDIEAYMNRFEETKQKANSNWSNFSQMISSEQIVTPQLGSFLEILGERLKIKFPNWYTNFLEQEVQALNTQLVDQYTELFKSRLEPQSKVRSKLVHEIPKLANEVLSLLRADQGKIEGDTIVLLENKIHQLQVIDQMIVQVYKELSSKFESFINYAYNHYLVMQKKQVKFSEDYPDQEFQHVHTGPGPKDIVYKRMGFNIFRDEVANLEMGAPLNEKLVRAFLEALLEEGKVSEGLLLHRHDSFEKVMPYGNQLNPENVASLDSLKDYIDIEWLGHYERVIFPVCLNPNAWLVAEIRRSPLEEINIYDSNANFAHLHEKIGLVLRKFVAKTLDKVGKEGDIESKKFLIKSKRVPVTPNPQQSTFMFLKNLILLANKHEIHSRSYSPMDIEKCKRRIQIFFLNASEEGDSELKLDPWEI